jgi:ribosomal protein S18 acetylase RimI-like enzyme
MTIGTLKPQRTSICAAFAQAAYYPVILDARHVPDMDRLQTHCGADNVVPRDAAFYTAHFADGQEAIGMIDAQGQLVAHALIRNHGTDTKMLNVLVDPQHRGQKLHGQMIDEWLGSAHEAGFHTASARVRLSATASFKNFSAAGFESVRVEPSPEAPHEITHVMVKPLSVQTLSGQTLSAQVPRLTLAA